MSIFEFERELEDARMMGDIYSIARHIMVLQLNGRTNYELLPEERKRLLPELERVRKQGHDFLKQGYMIARWHMLLSYFEVEVEVTEHDRRLIQHAVDQYAVERNFYQLASLLMTCQFIGVFVTYVLVEHDLWLLYEESLYMK